MRETQSDTKNANVGKGQQLGVNSDKEGAGGVKKKK